MAVQNLGNFGGKAPQPAPVPGNTPRPVAPQRETVPVEVPPQASAPPEQPSREQVQRAVEEMRKSISEKASSNFLCCSSIS